jgi:cysteinyl-tRNA synthetase
MSLRLYNSRTRAVEPFAALDPKRVRIYVCGLTPSAEAHLGHARSFMFFDVLRRYLTYLGYRVEFVRNVTDIDDRSIEAGLRTGVPWNEIVQSYFESFKRSMNRLHVLEPDREPRATEYVPEILAMIAALVAKGNAYAVEDGVYFAVDSFPRYGALSGRNVDELLVGARIAAGEHKRDPLDFALWKFAKPGEPSWPSPWGEGRPGWHIECSAMCHALLGEPFDIHGGGYDLIFPHHENEIAQTESLVGPPMANVWMHGGLLQFDGRKMSKSLGNFEPLYQLLDRHDPQAIRFLFLQTGYRKPMNFTEASIEGATTGLRRLQSAYDDLRTAPAAGHDEASIRAAVEPYETRFFEALDDDMNTSGAVSILFDLASEATALVAAGAASRAAAFLHEAMTLVGISPVERNATAPRSTVERSKVIGIPTDSTVIVQYTITRKGDAPLGERALDELRALLGEIVPPPPIDSEEAVDAVVEARLLAKSEKDFALADRLREALAAIGVVVKDAKDGATWTVGV